MLLAAGAGTGLVRGADSALVRCSSASARCFRSNHQRSADAPAATIRNMSQGINSLNARVLLKPRVLPRGYFPAPLSLGGSVLLPMESRMPVSAWMFFMR